LALHLIIFSTKGRKIEPCIVSDLGCLYPKIGVLIEKGLYPEEQWGEITVAWTKPVFTLHITPGIEKVSITAFRRRNRLSK
jgi:hypothetical protein